MPAELLVAAAGVPLWLLTPWAVLRWFRIPSRLARAFTRRTALIGDTEEAMLTVGETMRRLAAALPKEADVTEPEWVFEGNLGGIENPAFDEAVDSDGAPWQT